jgi:hypothetical protein
LETLRGSLSGGNGNVSILSPSLCDLVPSVGLISFFPCPSPSSLLEERKAKTRKRKAGQTKSPKSRIQNATRLSGRPRFVTVICWISNLTSISTFRAYPAEPVRHDIRSSHVRLWFSLTHTNIFKTNNLFYGRYNFLCKYKKANVYLMSINITVLIRLIINRE